jgi:hypothetical protein
MSPSPPGHPSAPPRACVIVPLGLRHRPPGPPPASPWASVSAASGFSLRPSAECSPREPSAPRSVAAPFRISERSGPRAPDFRTFELSTNDLEPRARLLFLFRICRAVFFFSRPAPPTRSLNRACAGEAKAESTVSRPGGAQARPKAPLRRRRPRRRNPRRSTISK